MKIPRAQKPPFRFTFLLATWTLCLIAFLAVAVVPAWRQTDRAKEEIAKLQAGLRQQEALRPIYLSLLERKQRQLPASLRIPDPHPLMLDNLAALPTLFEDLGQTSGLRLVAATPEVRSLLGGPELLRVDTRMRGQFHAFNELLHQLNNLPYVERIERLAIDTGESGPELRLAIWLTIQ